MNDEVGAAILRLAQVYDQSLMEEKSLRLEINTMEMYTLVVVIILSVGFSHIWENRKEKKNMPVWSIRAEL